MMIVVLKIYDELAWGSNLCDEHDIKSKVDGQQEYAMSSKPFDESG